VQRWVKGLLVGAGIAVLGALASLTPPGQALERTLGLSWLFHARGAIEPPADVLVVALDQESQQRLGLPPTIREWPRRLHAELVERLSTAGAAVIAFDVMFDRARDTAPDQDALLATAIARSGRVILLERLERSNLPLEGETATHLLVSERIVEPLPPLALAASGLAPFPLPKVPDRVDQFWAFQASVGEHRATLPALALYRFALDLHEEWLTLLAEAGAGGLDGVERELERLRNGGSLQAAVALVHHAFRSDPGLGRRVRAILATRDLPADARRPLAALVELHAGPDSRWLNFYGPPGQVRRFSLHQVLDEGEDGARVLSEVAGRAIFVGSSEVMNLNQDGFPTVFSRADGVDLSGVEIAATALANLLEDRLLEPAGPWQALLLVAAFGLAIGMIAVAPPAVVALPLALVVAALCALGAGQGFSRASLWLPLAVPLGVQLPLALAAGLVIRYREAQLARRNLARGVAYYLPERVVAGLAERAGNPAVATEPAFAVCLVSDAERFTSLAEGMAPADLNALLNRYFEVLFAAIERHGGIVTDVVGDGITAVWPGPAADPDCRRRACRAALAVAGATSAFNRRYGPPGLPTRIGMNAGLVMIGNVGGGGRFVYSVVGDVVNTAARIEQLNKQLGTRLLATDAVVEGLGEVRTRPLGRFRLHGRQERAVILELLAATPRPGEADLLAQFAVALAAFHEGAWGEAAARLQALLQRHPDDGPARFYLAQCRRCLSGAIAAPVAGVIQLEHK
jgi:adenylate cyclase